MGDMEEGSSAGDSKRDSHDRPSSSGEGPAGGEKSMGMPRDAISLTRHTMMVVSLGVLMIAMFEGGIVDATSVTMRRTSKAAAFTAHRSLLTNAPTVNQTLDQFSTINNGTLNLNVTRLWEYFLQNGTIPLELFSQYQPNAANGLSLDGPLTLFANDTFFNTVMDEIAARFPGLDTWLNQVATARSAWLRGMQSQGSTDVGLIVGIVVGVVGLLALLAALVTFFMMRRGRQRRVGLDDGNKPMQIDVKAFDDIESLKSTSSLAVSNVPAQGDNGDPVLQWIHSRQHKVEVLSASSSSNGSQSPGSQHHHRLHRTWSPTTEDSAKQSTHAVEIPEFLSNLEFSWDEIHVVRSLGVGSFGKVFLAKWNETPVAVKVLLDARELSASAGGHGSGVLSHTSYVAAASPSKLLEEIRITAALRHPNVVQFMGFSLDPPSMAAEYCPRGSLYHVLHEPLPGSESRRPLTWLRRVAFAADAAAGMLHLHSRSPQIIHRDLKSPNLLVMADWTVKVADMGLSKLLDNAVESGINSIMTSGGGLNPRWLAPEVLSGSPCTTASDVFSFSMVMWEIMTRKLPWEGMTTWVVVGNVQKGERPPLDSLEIEDAVDTSQSVQDFKDLVAMCWCHEPEKRPTFSHIAMKLREIQRHLLQEVSS